MSQIDLDESLIEDINTEKSFQQETDQEFHKKNSIKSSRKHSKTLQPNSNNQQNENLSQKHHNLLQTFKKNQENTYQKQYNKSEIPQNHDDQQQIETPKKNVHSNQKQPVIFNRQSPYPVRLINHKNTQKPDIKTLKSLYNDKKQVQQSNSQSQPKLEFKLNRFATEDANTIINSKNPHQQQLTEFISLRNQCIQELKNQMVQKSLNTLSQLIFKVYNHFKQQTGQNYSQYFQEFFNSTIKILCDISMKGIGKQDQPLTLKILNFCDQMTSLDNQFEKQPNLRVKVLNNLGCAYRRIDQLDKAIQYLKNALHLLQSFQITNQLGITYLNLCAVHSQRKEYQLAFECAKNSLVNNQQDLIKIQKQGAEISNPQKYEEKVRYVGISYYNLGSAQESMLNIGEANKWYQKAVQCSSAHFKQSNTTLYNKFLSAFKRTKNQISDAQESENILNSRRQRNLTSHDGSQNVKVNSFYFKNQNSQIQQQKKVPIKLKRPHSQTQNPMPRVTYETDFFEEKSYIPKSNSSQKKSRQQKQNFMKTYGNDSFYKYQTDYNNSSKQSLIQISQNQDNIPFKHVQKNNFMNNDNEQFEIQQQQQSIIRQTQRSGRSKTTQNFSDQNNEKILGILKNSKTFKNKQRDLSNNSKNLSDLEKMGVLDWTDSDEEDQNTDIQMKQKRLDFLKNMNNMQANNNTYNFNDTDRERQLEFSDLKLGTQNNLDYQSQKKSDQIDMQYYKNNEYTISKIQNYYRRKKQYKRNREHGKKILEQKRREKQLHLLKQKLAEKSTKIEKQQSFFIENDQQSQISQKSKCKSHIVNGNETFVSIKSSQVQQEQNQYNQYHIDKAVFIQQFYQKQVEKAIKNREIGTKRRQMLAKRQYKQYQNQAKILQNYTKTQKSKELKWIQQLKKQKQQKLDLQNLKLLSKNFKKIKIIKQDIFQEKDLCPEAYYQISLYSNLDLTALTWRIRLTEAEETLPGIYQKAQNKFIQCTHDVNTFLRCDQQVKQDLNLKLYKSPITFNEMKFIGNKITNILYLKNQQIYFEDITDIQTIELEEQDFPETKNSIQDYENHQPIQQQILELPYNLKKYDEIEVQQFIKIQKKYRSFYNQKKLQIIKQKKSKQIGKWNLLQPYPQDGNKHYLTITLFQSTADISSKYIFSGKYHNKRKNLQNFELNPELYNFYQPFDQDNIFDIISINLQTLEIELQELAIEKLNQLQGKHFNNKQSTNQQKTYNIHKIVQIQCFLRQCLAKQKLEFKILQKQKKQELKKEFISRSCILYKHEPYIVTLYYQENHSEQSYQLITTINLNNKLQQVDTYKKEKIEDCVQNVYSQLSKASRKFLGPLILGKTTLKEVNRSNAQQNKKIILKVPRIEEILSELTVNRKKAYVKYCQINNLPYTPLTIQSQTIESRKLFNQQTMRKKYFQHKSVVDITNVSAEQNYNQDQVYHFSSLESANKIQKFYKNCAFHRNYWVYKTKNIRCKDDEDYQPIKEYSECINAQSELAIKIFDNLHIFKEKDLKNVQEKLQKPKIIGELLDQDRNITINIILPNKFISQSTSFFDQSHSMLINQENQNQKLNRQLSKKLQTQKSQHDQNLIADHYIESENDSDEIEDSILETSCTANVDVYYQKDRKLIYLVGLIKYKDEEIVKQLVLNQILFENKTTLVGGRFNKQQFRKYLKKFLYDNVKFDGQNLFYEDSQQTLQKQEEEQQIARDLEKAKKQKELQEQKLRQIQQEYSCALLQIDKQGFRYSYSYLSITSEIYLEISQINSNQKKINFFLTMDDLDLIKEQRESLQVKATEELQNFFNQFLTQFTKELLQSKIIENKDEEKIIVSNFPIQKYKAQIYLKKIMVRKIILLFRKKYLKTQMLTVIQPFKKKNQIPIREEYIKNETSGNYYSLKFCMQKSDYSLIIIINRVPKLRNRKFKRKFQINLIQLNENFNPKSEISRLIQQSVELDVDPEPKFFEGKKFNNVLEISQNDKRIQNQNQNDIIDLYKRNLSDLILYITEQIRITQQNSKLNISFYDPRIPYTEIKFRQQEISQEVQLIKNKIYGGNLVSIFSSSNLFIHLARYYKKYYQSERLKMIHERKLQIQNKTRQIGEQVKRYFRQLQGIYYIINVYEKNNIYTFDLIPFRCKSQDKKIKDLKRAITNQKLSEGLEQKKNQVSNDGTYDVFKIRGVFEYDPKNMQNLQNKSIIDYLVDSLVLENNCIRFVETVFKEYDAINRHVTIDQDFTNRKNQNGPKLLSDMIDEKISEISSQRQRQFSQISQNIEENQSNIQQQGQKSQRFLQLPQNKQDQQNTQRSNKTLSQSSKLNQSNQGDIMENLSQLESKKEILVNTSHNQHRVSSLVDYQNITDIDTGISSLYNVVYVGQDKINLQQIQTKQTQDLGHEQSTRNNVNINVNLGELKKLYPTLDYKSKDAMKIIGQQLMEGIKVNENGKIEIDQSKINPHCIEIDENFIEQDHIIPKNYVSPKKKKKLLFDDNIEQEENKQQNDDQQNKISPKKTSLTQIQKQLKFQTSQQNTQLSGFSNFSEDNIQQQPVQNTNKQVLTKSIKFFRTQQTLPTGQRKNVALKYLIVIYLMERQVNKIIKDKNDKVFEEYEVLYQVCCQQIVIGRQKTAKTVTWEVTPQEINLISNGLKGNVERAKFLINKVQCYNNKILIVLDNKQHLKFIRPSKNLIVYYSAGIIPIQKYQRNKNFQKNYQFYLKSVKEMKYNDHIEFIHVPDELKKFIIYCKKDGKNHFIILGWDLTNYQMYTVTIKNIDIEIQLRKLKKEHEDLLKQQKKKKNKFGDYYNTNEPEFNSDSENENQQAKLNQQKQLEQNPENQIQNAFASSKKMSIQQISRQSFKPTQKMDIASIFSQKNKLQNLEENQENPQIQKTISRSESIYSNNSNNKKITPDMFKSIKYEPKVYNLRQKLLIPMSEYLDISQNEKTFIFKYENYLNWLKGVDVSDYK